MVFDLIRDDFNSYRGFVFERVCMKFLWEQELPFIFTKLGRWWHQDKEIDLVALNEDPKEIAFFEVKWRDLRTEETSRILVELKESRREREFEGGGYLCYDLEDT